MPARTSSPAKAARMPPSAASRSPRCRATTGNSRRRRFVPRFIRARATSRRKPSSASNRPPISAAARSGRRQRSMKSSSIAKANGLVTHMDGARLLERLRRHRNFRARYGRGLGFGLDRFLKRPRRAGRRRHRRLARFHRQCLALEAAARRLDAAGRHLRGGLRLRARPSRRPPRRRSCQCAGAGARAVADQWHRGAAARDQSGVLQA